ncbi:MAG: class I SAM-dependent methyltransferase [Syntrophales bacterium]
MNKQQSHYNRIVESYDEAYFDELSVKYREEFIYKPLFFGLSLTGKSLLEVGCGSGLNIKYLSKKYPELSFYGCDISDKAINRFKFNNPRHVGFVADLTQPNFSLEKPVDFCLGIGTLHHCVRDLKQAIENIANNLSDNGVLLLFEPNGEGWQNYFRNLWYRCDRKYFDSENERALSVDEIREISAKRFSVQFVKYFGGPAYFLILNSLIFRFSKYVKSSLFPILISAERCVNLFIGKYNSPAYLIRLIKLG